MNTSKNQQQSLNISLLMNVFVQLRFYNVNRQAMTMTYSS